MKNGHAIAWLAALALCGAGCGDETGEKKRGGGATPVDEPSWEGLSIDGRQSSDLLGETLRMAAGTFGPQGADGVVYAGRELLVVDEAGAPIWRAGWSGVSSAPYVAAHRVVDLAAVEATGDGISDLLLVDTWGEVHLLDGIDGSARWKHQLAQETVADGGAIFGSEAERLFYTSFSVGPLRLDTGTVAFRPALPGPPIFLAAAAQGAGEPSVALVSVERTGGALQRDLFVLGHDGTLLADYGSGGFVTALTAASFDEGAQVAIVGADRGRLAAVGLDGTERWSSSFELHPDSIEGSTYVDELVASDLDGDGVDEIVFTLRELQWDARTAIVVADAAGAELWRMPTFAPVERIDVIDGAEGPAIVAILGRRGEEMVVLDPMPAADTDPVRWRYAGTRMITSFAPLAEKLFVGAEDGVIRSFDPANGAALHEDYQGFFQMGASIAVGDTLFLADEAARLAARDLDGALQWHTLPDGAVPSVPRGLASFGAAGEEELALLLGRFTTDHELGMLHLVDRQGATRASIPIGTVPMELAVADLHGDGGADAVIVGKNVAHIEAEIVAVDLAAGATKWEAALPRKCEFGFVAAGEEGAGIGCFTGVAPPFVAFLDADGNVRWEEETIERPHWVRLVDGNLVVGGGGIDGEGFVASRDAATGELR